MITRLQGLRVVVQRDCYGYIATCVDHDIMAQGFTQAQVLARLDDCITKQRLLAQSPDGRPDDMPENIPPPPAKYLRAWLAEAN